MLLYILSFLDLITAFVIWSYVSWGWFSPQTVMYHAAYVLLKGAIFALHDFASKLDVISGFYALLLAFGIFSSPGITLLVVLYLGLKACLGFIKPVLSIFS